MKAFAAILAGVRPGVRVDEQVGGQRRAALEAFAALIALHVQSNGILLVQKIKQESSKSPALVNEKSESHASHFFPYVNGFRIKMSRASTK